jgi:hypothetical protein
LTWLPKNRGRRENLLRLERQDFAIAALLKRGPWFGLRLATRFPSTSGSAKHLVIGERP